MELYQFKFLDEAMQIETIKMQGVYLGERIEDKFTYKLYQIKDFYVEEKWHTAFNERRELLSFVSVDKLQPYLEVMDLSGLALR